jgi:hypothetical protein
MAEKKDPRFERGGWSFAARVVLERGRSTQQTLTGCWRWR